MGVAEFVFMEVLNVHYFMGYQPSLLRISTLPEFRRADNYDPFAHLVFWKVRCTIDRVSFRVVFAMDTVLHTSWFKRTWWTDDVPLDNKSVFALRGRLVIEPSWRMRCALLVGNTWWCLLGCKAENIFIDGERLISTVSNGKSNLLCSISLAENDHSFVTILRVLLRASKWAG